MSENDITALHGWIAIGSAILGWEIFSPPGQLLTDGAHRALILHPILTRWAIITTALHLLGILPPALDPYHQVGKIFSGCRGRKIFKGAGG